MGCDAHLSPVLLGALLDVAAARRDQERAEELWEKLVRSQRAAWNEAFTRIAGLKP